MKYFKKIASAILASAVVFTTVFVPSGNVSAAGASTLLYEFYKEKFDPDVEKGDPFPQLVVTASGGDSYNLYSGGHETWSWTTHTSTGGTKWGFPSSNGNVHRALFNAVEGSRPASDSSDTKSALTAEQAARTSLSRTEPHVFGMRFFGHGPGYGYGQLFTKSVADYANTGAVVVTVSVGEEEYVDDTYVYLNSYKDGKNSFTGVKIAGRYDKSKIGQAQQLCIPLSEFTNPGDNAYTYNGEFDPSALSGAGMMIVGCKSTKPGWIAYDNLIVCNVDRPTLLKASDSTDSQTTLSWDGSASDIVNYEVVRNGSVVATVGPDKTTYTDTGLTSKTDYEYEVYAVDKYGAKSSASNKVSIYTALVGAPKNLKANSSYNDELKAHLTWEAPAYGTVTGYEIYRDGVKIGDTASDVLTYEDKDGVSEDTYYTYTVKAITDGDTSMASNEKKVLVSYLGFPENVTVATDVTDIELSWDEIPSATSYNVFKNGSKIATVEAPATSYIDEEWDASTMYTYTITSVNDTRESTQSEKVYAVKSEVDKTAAPIYSDIVADGYFFTTIGSSAYEVKDNNAPQGKKMVEITYPTGSFAAEGLTFAASTASGVDVSALRSGGGRLEFAVYAENEDMIKNIRVGLECDTTLSSKTYTARTGFDISDYITQYGYWNYVSIPFADFSSVGIFTENQTRERYCTFNFNKVTGIAFYSTSPAATAQTINIDNVNFATFSAPTLPSATLNDGTALAANQTISAAENQINFIFTTDMDAASFNGNVKLVATAGADKTNLPAECEYDAQTKTLKVKFTAGLEKSTNYSVMFNGVKSAKGAVYSAGTFDFVTNDDETSGFTVMSDKEYVKFDSQSVSKGGNVTVKLALDSAEAKTTAIDAMDINVEYDPLVLSLVASNVKPASSISNAVVTVETDRAGKQTGKANIKIENTSAKYVMGSYIAELTFSASHVGGSKVEVSGTVHQASPVKNVEIAQSGVPQITVVSATYNIVGGSGSGSGSGGGSGSSFGGGRNEAAGSKDPNVSVSDSTSPSKEENYVFSDSKNVDWATDAIEYLGKNEIINGYEDGSFRPEADVTREEFVAMIVRAFSEVKEGAKVDFKDASEGDWYYDALATAAELEIVSGFDGSFGVGDTISRQDMCTMLYRAANALKISVSDSYNTIKFADESEIADYAKESVQKLQKAGIVNGVGNSEFDPNGKVTRAMAAKVIYELTKLK